MGSDGHHENMRRLEGAIIQGGWYDRAAGAAIEGRKLKIQAQKNHAHPRLRGRHGFLCNVLRYA